MRLAIIERMGKEGPPVTDRISRNVGQTELAICTGDITRQTTEAIVNAANSGLRGGGGVDGAIHRAAGPSILQECQDYVRANGPLPPGKAMWTHGGNLSARYVIHTVGPIYQNEETSAPILRCAYLESMKLAEELGGRSLSFPLISTGAYGYPVDAAARVALQAIVGFLRTGSTMELIQIVCFTADTFTACETALRGLVKNG